MNIGVWSICATCAVMVETEVIEAKPQSGQGCNRRDHTKASRPWTRPQCPSFVTELRGIVQSSEEEGEGCLHKMAVLQLVCIPSLS